MRLTKQFKAEAKTLAKQQTSATNQAMPTLIPQILSLLDRVLNQSPTEKSSGFSFNLFGKNKPPKQEPDRQHEMEQQILIADVDNSSPNKIPIHRVLMDLLERLSLSTELSKKATKIRHQIESGIQASHDPQDTKTGHPSRPFC